MLIAHTIGGIGNQMFQYAAGRALSLSRKVPLSLDIADFADYKLHQGFELQRVFDCPIRIASKEEVRDRLGWQSLPLVRRVLARPYISPFRRPCMVFEPHFNHWPGFNDVPDNSYLIGYWQSERYFNDFADQIRDDFQFIKPLDPISTEISDEIRASVSVSLHVRRGDYVSNSKSTAVYSLCEPRYYANAIEYITDRLGPIRLFVFSDDIEWARANLPIGAHSHTFVSHNKGADSWRDMQLMSMCKHNIIANSSFSWWGAWLNASKTKIVVAPKKWFANDNDAKDLFPNEWLLL